MQEIILSFRIFKAQILKSYTYSRKNYINFVLPIAMIRRKNQFQFIKEHHNIDIYAW